ncbi:hypothetical protein [Bradyrhizobium acaciae]|uniref:hypothetical protein n=1 Tax=Bradyrhizobium acaciae TaxID=2683706 RepID=UPI00237A9462|nr:hypothetical protein [Bradyrhizobium acaciae]MCC8984679.1 hypothetical protein [Bradyrhizobium acaciae]
MLASQDCLRPSLLLLQQHDNRLFHEPCSLHLFVRLEAGVDLDLEEIRDCTVHRRPDPQDPGRLEDAKSFESAGPTVRQLERGGAGALQVIDTLDLTLRENRRIKMALRMTKPSTTLAGF